MRLNRRLRTKSDPYKALASEAEYQVFDRVAPVKSLLEVPPPEYPKVDEDPRLAQQALIVMGTSELRIFAQMLAAALKAVLASSGNV